MDIPEEIKKFRCTMCANSFNEELMLKKHIQRHYDGRFITCSVPNCKKGFTTKHQLTKHLKNAHPNKDSANVPPPRRIAVKRSLGAPGKHNCYFESCDAHFDTSDLLNEHLTSTHGLSIVKNAGKRSKMDVMFSEQLKNQTNEQNFSVVNNKGSATDPTKLE